MPYSLFKRWHDLAGVPARNTFVYNVSRSMVYRRASANRRCRRSFLRTTRFTTAADVSCRTKTRNDAVGEHLPLPRVYHPIPRALGDARRGR